MTRIPRMELVVARCSLLLLAGLWGNGVQQSFAQTTSFTIKLEAGRAARVDGLAFSPDGKLLAALVDRVERTGGVELFLYETAKRKLVERIPLGANQSGQGVAFTPDGKQVITSTLRNLNGDPLIEFWDVATRKRSAHATINGAARQGGVIAPDGKSVAYPSEMIQLFDLRSGKQTGTLVRVDKFSGTRATKRRWATCMAYSPDCKQLVAGFSDGRVALWDLSKEKSVWSIQQYDETTAVAQVAFSPDGRKVVTSPGSGGDRRLVIIRTKDGHEETALHYALLGVYGFNPRVAFTPDGESVLFSGMLERQFGVFRWEVKGFDLQGVRPSELKKESEGRCLAISPDRKTLVTGGQQVVLWQVDKIDTPLKRR